ncbi:hypothetical protein [uncultured Tateyamaria sp.]|uniref:hypothetical protein n=1 Tax=uncultured Tateyamaria sp. TaxID=455651 RepID=UPI0026320DE9|nr:hypothetical protein [uncultured Tateyamaria sp.]
MKLLLKTILALGVAMHATAGEPATVRGLADQAVLVHRITKSVCLLFVGAQTPVHAEDVAASVKELSLLSASVSMQSQANAHLSQEVATLTKSAQQIVAGDRHTVPVTLLLKTNPTLAFHYSQMRYQALSQVPHKYRASYAVLHELRVVSQAFQRDLCLFLTELAPTGAERAMIERISYFKASLDALIVGNAVTGLVAAPNIHIKVILGKVASKWNTLEAILSAAASGDMIDPRDVQLASVLGDAILENLDQISDRFLAL